MYKKLHNIIVIGTIDYVLSYFKYKTPTSIWGELISKSLKLELQANTSSVEKNLRGENYGYLGLILIDEEYITIPNTQYFIAPNYPLLLVILDIATPIQVLELKDVYQEARRLYLEYKNAKKYSYSMCKMHWRINTYLY